MPTCSTSASTDNLAGDVPCAGAGWSAYRQLLPSLVQLCKGTCCQRTSVKGMLDTPDSLEVSCPYSLLFCVRPPGILHCQHQQA